MPIQDRFPTIVQALERRDAETRRLRPGAVYTSQVTRFEQAITRLEAGLQAGFIQNADFQELKAALSRAVEYGWDVVEESEPREIYTSEGRANSANEALRQAISNLSSPINGIVPFVRSNTKRLAAVPDHPFFERARAFVAEVEPIARTFEALKAGDMIKKRQPRPAEEREARYVAPQASSAGMRRVRELLELVVQDARNDLVRASSEHYHQIVSRFLEAQSAAGKVLSPREYLQASLRSRRTVSYSEDRALNEFLEPRGSGREVALRQAPWHPVADLDARIKALAEREADEVREVFVHKNLKKIDSIVEKKGNITEGQVLGRAVSLTALTGRLRFLFSDGSAFTVQNSVVLSHSTSGKPFYRFPLTFHDVVMSNGIAMPRPSEERMNTVFVAVDLISGEEPSADGPAFKG